MRELKLRNTESIVLVDDEDWERLSQFKWHEGTRGIFRSYWLKGGGKSVTVMLPSEIMNQQKETFDHKDRNYFNNQKSNLRPCTYSQNNMNRGKAYGSSKYKGVSFQTSAGKWKAQIRMDDKLTYLGLFISEEEAARVYDKAALEKFKEFAVLNFPLSLA